MSKVSKGCICAFERVVIFKYTFLLKNTYLENLTYKTNTQRDKYIHMFKKSLANTRHMKLNQN